nr:MAG TPA: hypothetical protein [Microviridae sp.]
MCAHIGNLINYMRTDTKDLLTNRFGGNGINTVCLHSEYLIGVLSELCILIFKYLILWNFIITS